MREIWITFKKELRSVFRDKRTVVTLLLFPLLIPVMIFLYAYMYEDELENDVYKIGVNYDVNEVEESFLKESYLDGVYYDSLSEMRKAYSDKEIYAYIDYSGGSYVIYVNEDSSDGMKVSGYISSYLEGYNTYLAKASLVNDGIDVENTFNNISYEIVDLEGENWLLNLMFTIAFTYIVMSVVIATTNMATTATAVEKENGTLETILTFPIRVKNLIMGKYFATVFMGVLSSLIGLVLTILSLNITIKYSSFMEGLSYRLDVCSVSISILIIIIASLFIGGLSILLTSFTKSYKEAQSVSSVLNILTVIPLFISIIGVKVEVWYYLIPILNYTQVLMDVFSGNINVMSILMVVISSFVYVGIVLFYIIIQYKSEKVLFGR